MQIEKDRIFALGGNVVYHFNNAAILGSMLEDIVGEGTVIEHNDSIQLLK